MQRKGEHERRKIQGATTNESTRGDKHFERGKKRKPLVYNMNEANA
jgi:hypothetical protein